MKKVDITRPVVAGSEPGTGTADLSSRFTLTGFVGMEHDQSRKSSDYSATGVTALQSFAFNDPPKKTRPAVSLGGIHDIDNTHQLSAQGVYRKEAFTSVATSSLLATCSAGF